MERSDALHDFLVLCLCSNDCNGKGKNDGVATAHHGVWNLLW